MSRTTRGETYVSFYFFTSRLDDFTISRLQYACIFRQSTQTHTHSPIHVHINISKCPGETNIYSLILCMRCCMPCMPHIAFIQINIVFIFAGHYCCCTFKACMLYRTNSKRLRYAGIIVGKTPPARGTRNRLCIFIIFIRIFHVGQRHSVSLFTNEQQAHICARDKNCLPNKCAQCVDIYNIYF